LWSKEPNTKKTLSPDLLLCLGLVAEALEFGTTGGGHQDAGIAVQKNVIFSIRMQV
jgi:hypothetical protein